MRKNRTTGRSAVFIAFLIGSSVALAGDVNYLGVTQATFGPVSVADLLMGSGVSFVPPVSTVTVVAPTPSSILNGGPVGAMNPGYDPIAALMSQSVPTSTPSNPYSAPFSNVGGVGSFLNPPTSSGGGSPLSGGLDLVSLLGVTPTTGNSLFVVPVLATSPILVTPTTPTSTFNPQLGIDNPEPSTWVLMLGGLGAVFFLRRRLVAR